MKVLPERLLSSGAGRRGGIPAFAFAFALTTHMKICTKFIAMLKQRAYEIIYRHAGKQQQQQQQQLQELQQVEEEGEEQEVREEERCRLRC